MYVAFLIVFFLLCGISMADVNSYGTSAHQKNDQAIELLLNGKFQEADQFLASWEQSNPEDNERIVFLRAIESKIKTVTSKEEREKIYTQELMSQMTKAADQMKGVAEDMKQISVNADKPAEPERPLSPLDKELLAAIRKKDTAQVNELIKKGANVNCKGFHGLINPLLSAIEQSDVEIVRILLEAGANSNKKNKEDMVAQSPLYHAISNHEASIVNLLIKHGADVHEESMLTSSLLIAAIEKGNLQIVESLINAGVDINKWDLSNNTALMHAVEIGNAEFVKLLLKNGAKTTMRNNKDQTALDIAKKQGNEEIIKLLSTL